MNDAIWMFTGQGALQSGAAAALYGANPTFREALERYTEVLADTVDLPLLELLTRAPAGAADPLLQTRYGQPALVALQLAQLAAWRERGMRPALVLGHSIGEFAAAVAAGAMKEEDALRLAAVRGSLMAACPPGAMAAVFAPATRFQGTLPPELVVAADNGPATTVLAGPQAALERYLSGDLRDGHTMLAVSHAFHSPMMAPAAAAFRAHLAGVALAPASQVPFVSTMTGELAREELASPDYWAEQILQPVRFMPAFERALALATRAGAAVELGPAATLIGLGRRIAPAAPLQWIASQAALAEAPRRARGAGLFRKVPLGWAKPSAKPAAAKTAAAPAPVEATPDNCVYETEWVPASAAPGAQAAPAAGSTLLISRLPYAGALPPGWRAAVVDGAAALPALLTAEQAQEVVLAGSGDALDVEIGLRLLQLAAEGAGQVAGVVFATAPGAAGGAGLWGLARAVRLERPELRLRTIECAPDAVAEAVNACAPYGADTELAVDAAGLVRTARLRRCALLEAEEAPVRADATYVISGGRGALGLVAARMLVDAGATHLLLLSRTPLTADAVPEELTALRSRARVECLACDVAVGAGVLAARDWLAQAGWPAAAGVIHTAGVLSDGTLASQSADKLRLVYGAKVDGARNLRAAFAPLDFLLLYSSASATFGSAGQANYAAANSELDALARDWSQAGENVLSIQWGAWTEAGMAMRKDGAKRAAANGAGGIANALGAAVLRRLLAAGKRGTVCVSPIDWNTLALDIPLVARLRPRTVASAGGSLDAEELRAIVQAAVLGAVGTAVADDVALLENGLDSLGSVSLRNELASRLKVDLASSFVFDFPTVNEMVRHLAGQVARKGEAAAPAASPQAAQSDLPVLVIGAGIGGLGFARQLEKAGVPVVVMDAAERAGGVWQSLANVSSKLQIDSAPYDFDSTSMPAAGDHRWNAIFPQQGEIVAGCAAAASALSGPVHFGTRVRAVRKIGDQEYEVSYEQAGRAQAMRVSGVAAMTGGLHRPRQHGFPGEERFRGHVALGVANDTPLGKFAGARVVIVGHGAFAVENMRTALENGARHVTLLCRQRQLVMSTFCNWLLNSNRGTMPVNEVVDVMRPFYAACGVEMADLPSLLRDGAGNYTLDQSTVPPGSDLYFLAQMMGKLSIVVDEAADFEADAVLTAKGRRIEADILLKCLGSHTDDAVLLDLFGPGSTVRGLWVNGDRNLFTYNDGGQVPRAVKSLMCASYAFFAQAFAPAYLKFRSDPAGFERALGRITNESATTTTAERVLIELWDFLEPAKRVLAERIAERCPFDRFQVEREAEWERYSRMLGGTEAQAKALWKLLRPTLALMHRRNPNTPAEQRSQHPSLGALSVFVPARRRVLFLPGQGTNARLARALLERTGWIGRTNLDFVVPDAPYEMPAFTNEEQLRKIGLDGLVEAGLYDKSARYREWRAGFDDLFAQHHQGTPIPVTAAIRAQWDTTLAYVREIARTYGPFDGIAGFCEGAAVASVALHLQASGADLGLDAVRFFIAMSPWRSPLHHEDGMFRPDRPLQLPMLQIVGDNDMDVFLKAAPHFLQDYANAVEFRHNGQHVYPPLTPGLEAKLKQLLDDSEAGQYELAA